MAPTLDFSTLTFPTFLFHETEAREGKLFQSADDLPADPTGWFDTPQKFDPAYVPPPPSAVPDGALPADARRNGFVPQPYPSVRYNRLTLAEKVVASAEEDDTLDPAVWKHSPDPKTWDEPETPGTVTTQPPRPAGADADDPPPPPAATAPTKAEQRAALYKATVSHIIERVSGMTDRAVLDKIATFEAENPKGTRTTVLKAVKARLKELDAPAGE